MTMFVCTPSVSGADGKLQCLANKFSHPLFNYAVFYHKNQLSDGPYSPPGYHGNRPNKVISGLFCTKLLKGLYKFVLI